MTPRILKVLVTVKAYPAISRKHGEAVCVAGIDAHAPRWIRLFPVPFRDLTFTQRFKKFDIIEVAARKSSDPRPESYEPNVDTIRIVGHVDSKRADERRRYIDPLMRPSMCAVRRERAAVGTSLGVFRPAGEPELLITEDRTPWEPDKQMIVDQPSMLIPTKKGLEKLPYRFLYRYACAGEPSCSGHLQSIVDWEIAEAYRSWREQYGDEQALEKIKRKWTQQLWAPDRDASLFVGNQLKNPDGFMVLGVFWPPKLPTGGGSAGPARDGLLPPR
jgi:hypothetical protein